MPLPCFLSASRKCLPAIDRGLPFLPPPRPCLSVFRSLSTTLSSAHVSPCFLVVVSFLQTHSYSRRKQFHNCSPLRGHKEHALPGLCSGLPHRFGFVCIVVCSTSIFLSLLGHFRLCFVEVIEDTLEISFSVNDPFNPDILTL